jgi:hypothetical protein
MSSAPEFTRRFLHIERPLTPALFSYMLSGSVGRLFEELGAGASLHPGYALRPAPGARHISIDICPRFRYKARISLTSGTSTGDSRWMGRVRFLRAGLVTPLSGGLGIVPAGITPGARGAPLKRD